MAEHMETETVRKVRMARTYKDLPPEAQLGYTGTLGELLRDRAQAAPEQPFLIHYNEANERTEYSYGAFYELVQQAANYLSERLGLRRGDAVSTVAHNHADTVVLYFAAWSLGLTVVPINVSEDDERITFILNNANVRVAFVRPDYLARVVGLRHALSQLERVVKVGGEPGCGVADNDFWGEIRECGTEFTTPQPFDNNQDALIVYTSGTTGAPKGVLLNQYNLLVDARGIMRWHNITADQRTMCVLPIHHVNGLVVTVITPLLAGATTVLNRAFSPRWFWQRLASERVQIVSVVPTLLAYLLEADEDLSRYDLSAFRYFICGAGPLTVQLAQAFEERFGHTIVHGYGLSETTCYSCFLPTELGKAAHRHWMRDYGYPSIGTPIEPNEMAIHDLNGNSLPPGPENKGEIVIRGHNVMQGYYRRPDANASAFAHGWFRSGDEGFMVEDEEGRPYFFITGRIKELIIRGGVNYSPFEIDEVLTALPGVKVGLAVGFPNKYYGEEVGAYIVPEEGVTITVDQILKGAREALSFSKSPKVVVFGDEVPVTSTGKYQRLRLAPLFAEFENSQFREK